VEGYGAFGKIYRPSFSNELISLLDRGFIYAQVHVRGSGELGKAWHQKGKGLNKRNSFYDFSSSINYLVDNKYADPSNVFAYGKEAGGLLVSATVNMNPKLFKGIILENPYTDVLRLYESKSADYYRNSEEFGDITDRFNFNYISSYNPYLNIPKENYPNLLLISDENSKNFSDNIKFLAQLRDSTSNNKLFFKSFDNTRLESNEKELLKYSFLLDNLK
ncbi:MAG: prolyl oligopeptidase family serine peptidase, partial [Candidatus Sericytochromatia bacterium]